VGVTFLDRERFNSPTLRVRDASVNRIATNQVIEENREVGSETHWRGGWLPACPVPFGVPMEKIL